MRIVAVSFNSADRNRRWAEAEHFPFEVWSDTDKTLALTYGAASTSWAPFPSRITVVLDAQGKVALQYLDGVNVGTHPEDVLKDCTALFGAAPSPPAPEAGKDAP